MGQEQMSDGALVIPMQSMDVRLPATDAADLVQLASQVGVPTDEFLGVCTLIGAYGHGHPEVQAFKERTVLGVGGTVSGLDAEEASGEERHE